MKRAFNVSTKKVGGIRFFKLGRINFSVSVSLAHGVPREAVGRRAKRSARPATTLPAIKPAGFDLEAEMAAMLAHQER